MLFSGQATRLSNLAQQAADSTRKRTRQHWDEDRITNRFIDQLEVKFDGYQIRNFDVVAEKLPDGKFGAEQYVGSDLIFCFFVVMPNRAIATGVMAQAKYYETWKNNSALVQMARELKDSSNTMMSHSPASYGLVYMNDSYRYFPSQSLASINPTDYGMSKQKLYKDVTNQDTRAIFELLFRGNVGDPWIAKNLRAILNTTNSNLPPRVMPDGGPQEVTEGGPTGISIGLVSRESDYEFNPESPFDDSRFFGGE